MAKTETGVSKERQQQTALQMLEQKLQSAPNLKSALSMPIVEQRFITDYKASTQKDDGKARYPSEVLSYMELVSENPALAAAERWQHFQALAKVGRTGLSLRGGGDLYVYPGKNNTIKVEPTPTGRRKQMEAMKEIKRFPEAQIVMKGDTFVHDKLNNIIKEHATTEKSKPQSNDPTLADVVASYQRIYWKNGTIEDIVVYHGDLLQAKAKSPAQQAGLWQKFPDEACKKTATKRAHRLYHKYPDGVMTSEIEEEEEETTDVQHTDVDFMPNGDKVDKSSGEVVEEAKVVQEEKTKQPESFI